MKNIENKSIIIGKEILFLFLLIFSSALLLYNRFDIQSLVLLIIVTHHTHLSLLGKWKCRIFPQVDYSHHVAVSIGFQPVCRAYYPIDKKVFILIILQILTILILTKK